MKPALFEATLFHIVFPSSKQNHSCTQINLMKVVTLNSTAIFEQNVYLRCALVCALGRYRGHSVVAACDGDIYRPRACRVKTKQARPYSYTPSYYRGPSESRRSNNFLCSLFPSLSLDALSPLQTLMQQKFW